MKPLSLMFFTVLLLVCSSLQSQETSTIRVLIVDGQNNHDQWPKVTVMLKDYLHETGLFAVDVERSAYTWKGEEFIAKYPIKTLEATIALEEPKTDADFKPDFSKYDVVICNFGWNAAPWPSATQTAFEAYIESGGGLVVFHAADNSFPKWEAYNKMIGLGGWGDRTEKDGPYVYYNDAGGINSRQNTRSGGFSRPSE